MEKEMASITVDDGLGPHRLEASYLIAIGISLTSNVMSDHDELKWECASCTYLNYPSAILCTMCRSSKNHSSPCINEPPSTSGDDWKKFDARNERWSCSACTYLNVLKARTCSVCSSKRPEYLNSKPELEDTPQIDDKGFDLSKALNKWDCSMCTYKNWPAVKSCVICRTPRQIVEIGDDDLVPLSPIQSTEKERRSPNSFETMEPLQRYLICLQKTVDTGCISFLEAVYQLICLDDDNVDRILHYLYNYSEQNRKITALESSLFNQLADFDNTIFYNRSFVDMLDFRDQNYLSNIPVEYYNSSPSVQFPGSVSSDGSDEIHARIREDIFNDLDLCRMTNSSALFNVPEVVYDLREWLIHRDKRGILMNFDENHLMYTICGSDTHNPSTNLGQERYAPLILRNRGGGHSLVDAVSQALWGVIDKNNLLRGAVYRTLFAQEIRFRAYWESWILKLGLNLCVYALQRYWENVLDCHEPGSAMEQIHILVLAQILNRPIVVLPIESSKANMIPRCDKSVKEKHPMEGFYPQLAVFNNYRLCRPLFLCYANGCFHAVILPPPQRSPVFGKIKADRAKRVFRYLRCPSFPLEHYVQFAVNDAETLEFIKFGLVVDVDSEGNRWIYHSSFIVPKDSEMATEKDSGTILWHRWMASHFPRKNFDLKRLFLFF
ncbi:unnamed protein product [Dracunculus medinensis]|uniref:Ubiquitinyl hydrolase 1 n=1 Tax=Dracunculus medinensis TaxID=318479 RepID=A0A0N4U9S1_DRAME|nr:unnamed protein product [Dracunculus medinensis]